MCPTVLVSVEKLVLKFVASKPLLLVMMPPVFVPVVAPGGVSLMILGQKLRFVLEIESRELLQGYLSFVYSLRRGEQSKQLHE
jgi:hypothetical protein